MSPLKRTLPCVSYAQSLGAIAKADHGDSVGQRLAHDKRFDQARIWGLEYFVGDAPRLSAYFCELAMFCDAYGETSKARDLLLEGLATGGALQSPVAPVLSAAIAHALATLDGSFAQKILAWLSDHGGPSITVQLGGKTSVEAVLLPLDVPISLAEDLVAIAIVSHFCRSHADAKPPIDQLAIYLDAVNTAGESNGPSAEARKTVPLPEIVLAVLVQLAMRARRQKCEQELAAIRCDLISCLHRFGRPISSYPESLVGALKRFGRLTLMRK